MLAVRARHAFDGEQVRPGGAVVLVESGRILGVEPIGFTPPDGCEVIVGVDDLAPVGRSEADGLDADDATPLDEHDGAAGADLSRRRTTWAGPDREHQLSCTVATSIGR